MVSDMLLYSHESVRCQWFQSPGYFSCLVSFHSCTFNHNVPFFEILWPRYICSRDILLGLFCGSLQFVPHSSFFLPSFWIVDILPLPSFFHYTNNLQWNPWLSCFSVDLPNCANHSIEHTFLGILPLHFNIPTFTFGCTEVFFYIILHCLLLGIKLLQITSWFFFLEPYNLLQSSVGMCTCPVT